MALPAAPVNMEPRATFPAKLSTTAAACPAASRLVPMPFESRISGSKDIVKISNRELSKEEVDRIALLAPEATINIIRDYRVFEKMKVEIPKSVTGFVRCPNPGCITNSNEPVESSFETKRGKLQCIYCDAIISENIAEYII